MPRTISPTSPKPSRAKTNRRQPTPERSDVLVSAVISTYLLTHLHHVLQRAEYGAQQEGRLAQANNYAELRRCSASMPAAWKMPRLAALQKPIAPRPPKDQAA